MNSLHNTNPLVFVTEMQWVFWKVRNEFSYILRINFRLPNLKERYEYTMTIYTNYFIDLHTEGILLYRTQTPPRNETLWTPQMLWFSPYRAVNTMRRHYKESFNVFFCPMPPHVLVDFVVLPPGHDRSVTDFRGWDAHEAQLRCPDDVSGDIGGCSARMALKPKFYQPTQTMVTAGILPFRENSHGRAGNRTRDLMISSQRLWPLDHEAGQNRLMLLKGTIDV